MKTCCSYYDTVKEFQNFHPTDSNFSFRAGSLSDLGEFFSLLKLLEDQFQDLSKKQNSNYLWDNQPLKNDAHTINLAFWEERLQFKTCWNAA